MAMAACKQERAGLLQTKCERSGSPVLDSREPPNGIKAGEQDRRVTTAPRSRRLSKEDGVLQRGAKVCSTLVLGRRIQNVHGLSV